MRWRVRWDEDWGRNNVVFTCWISGFLDEPQTGWSRCEIWMHWLLCGVLFDFIETESFYFGMCMHRRVVWFLISKLHFIDIAFFSSWYRNTFPFLHYFVPLRWVLWCCYIWGNRYFPLYNSGVIEYCSRYKASSPLPRESKEKISEEKSGWRGDHRWVRNGSSPIRLFPDS